jgi:23S rRNA (uracil1939-C5)-methyltransferase
MADRKKVKKVPESVVCQKNDIVTLEIIDMGAEGEGIARLEGYTLFVKDALVGDIIKACVMKTKKRFGYARLLEILEPSPYRVEPKCPVAKQCGGCQLQHCSYEKQLLWKQEKVLNCLQRIGGFQDVAMEPILAMDKPFYYRNKAQFPVGVDKDGNLIAGFYASRTHSIIQNTDCVIQHPCNREIVETVLQFMRDYNIPAYNEKDHLGMVRHILTRVGVNTGEVMVCLVINGSFLPEAEELKNRLLSCRLTGKNGNPELIMKSICININKEKTNVILGQKVKVIYGDGFIKDKIGNIIYQISPLSFYQVNPEQTKKLYDTVLEFADLQGGEVVWDLYCGIGSISLFLAQKAAKVCGVEIVPEAIEDARKNAALNHFSNTEFFVGAAEEVVPEQYGKSEGRLKADVVTLDPPRKGCDEKLLETVVGMEPKRIVYVSCDPATLARDLRYLCDRGYEIQRVRACDMFGMGYHVETVCLLSKLHSDQHIEVELQMDELDLTAAESKATYEEIKDYVLEHTGLKVSSLYIAQVKEKCGIIERANYNLPKSENSRQPKCPPEKEKAIRDALEHFRMV